MKKQKVLIVHNYYQTPGGEDTVVENEKNLLINNGHEVVLYTRHNDEIKTRGIIRKLLLPLEAIFSIKTYKEVKRKIIEENIDIVHVHNTLPLISPSVYYSAFSCKNEAQSAPDTVSKQSESLLSDASASLKCCAFLHALHQEHR